MVGSFLDTRQREASFSFLVGHCLWSDSGTVLVLVAYCLFRNGGVLSLLAHARLRHKLLVLRRRFFLACGMHP